MGSDLRKLGIPVLIAGAMALLSACNLPSREPESPTPSSDQVLQTAQAIAQTTLDAATSTPTSVPPSETPGTPTETFTPEATSTPSVTMVTADYNANVRGGPGEEYDIIDFILAGEQADVAGRYDNTPIGTWWFIRRTGELGRDGWVWGGAVTLSGSEAGVPVLEPPPTPTPSPEPTSPPDPTTETPTPTPTSTI